MDKEKLIKLLYKLRSKYTDKHDEIIHHTNFEIDLELYNNNRDILRFVNGVIREIKQAK